MSKVPGVADRILHDRIAELERRNAELQEQNEQWGRWFIETVKLLGVHSNKL